MLKPRHTHTCSPGHRQAQQGAVLIIALIMLLLLTIIGVTSVSTTSLEEKMVGNLYEYNLAFEAAEVALREGEAYLENTALIVKDSSDGVHDRGNAPTPLDTTSWSDTAQWRSSTQAVSLGQGAAGYHIEYLGTIEAPTGKNVGFSATGGKAASTGITGYRVVAWGTGRNATVKVVLSSYYGKL